MDNEHRIFYFAPDGSYGDASGMVLLRYADLGEEGMVDMNRMADEGGANPYAWATQASREYGEPIECLTVDSAKIIISQQAEIDLDDFESGRVEQRRIDRIRRTNEMWDNLTKQLKPKRKLW